MWPSLRRVLCQWCFKPLRQKQRGCHGRTTCDASCKNKLYRFRKERETRPSLQRVVRVKLGKKYHFIHVE